MKVGVQLPQILEAGVGEKRKRSLVIKKLHNLAGGVTPCLQAYLLYKMQRKPLCSRKDQGPKQWSKFPFHPYLACGARGQLSRWLSIFKFPPGAECIGGAAISHVASSSWSHNHWPSGLWESTPLLLSPGSHLPAKLPSTLGGSSTCKESHLFHSLDWHVFLQHSISLRCHLNLLGTCSCILWSHPHLGTRRE